MDTYRTPQMTRYYVYTLNLPNGEKRALFVDDIEAFATDVFNPINMEFTHAVIDADDKAAASAIFKKPKAADRFYYSDEPECTAIKRRQVEEIKRQQAKKKDLKAIARGVELKQLQDKLGARVDDLYVITRDISRVLYNSSDNPQLTVDEIHDRLLRKLSNHFRSLGSGGNDPEPEADGSF
jgi:hypothetical protein